MPSMFIYIISFNPWEFYWCQSLNDALLCDGRGKDLMSAVFLNV